MKEYIEREAANEACREAVRRCPNSFYNGIEAVRDAIRKLPAADVRPVRRGTWLPIIEGNEYGETYQTGCYCSECNEVLQHEPNFCPNCGARMGGDEDV